MDSPCHESWDSMANIPGGKFCSACQKNVVDFSKMSNQQILVYLAGKDKLCGKFGDFQLEGLNYYLSVNEKQPSFFKRWSFAALFMGLVPFINYEANAKPVTLEHNTPKKSFGSNENIKYRKISGIVSYRGLAVAGALVKVENRVASTMTNRKGYFEISIPVTAKVLQISYVGCKTATIQLRQGKNSGYDIFLSPESLAPAEQVFLNSQALTQDTTNANNLLINSKFPNYFTNSFSGAVGGIVVQGVKVEQPESNTVWYKLWTK